MLKKFASFASKVNIFKCALDIIIEFLYNLYLISTNKLIKLHNFLNEKCRPIHCNFLLSRKAFKTHLSTTAELDYEIYNNMYKS